MTTRNGSRLLPTLRNGHRAKQNPDWGETTQSISPGRFSCLADDLRTVWGKTQGKSQEKGLPVPMGQCPLPVLWDIPPLLNTGMSLSPRAATGCNSHPHYSHPPCAASSFLWNHVSGGAEAAHFCAGTSESTGRIKESEEFPSLILSVHLKVVSSTRQEKETEDSSITCSRGGCCRVFPVNLLLLHKTMSSSFCSSRQVCSEKGELTDEQMLESVLLNEHLKIAAKLSGFKVLFHVVPEVQA